MARLHSALLEDINRYYDKRESRWGYRWLLKGTRHYGYYPNGSYIPIRDAHDAMERRLAEALDLCPGSLVLDAGSGEGHVALRLAAATGLKVHGVDINARSVARAQKLAQKRSIRDVSFSQGDFIRLPYPDSTFDGVFTMETLVHAPDYRAALAEFYRILTPGGKVTLFEYSISGKRTESQERLWRDIADGSAMHSLMKFEHGHLADAVREAGFANVDDEDITRFTLPMLRLFYRLGWLPYQFVRLFHAERKFANTAAAAGVYRDVVDHGAWRYNIVTGFRPV